MEIENVLNSAFACPGLSALLCNFAPQVRRENTPFNLYNGQIPFGLLRMEIPPKGL